VEVRKEDQDKINRFSSLHQRESVIEGELKQKQVSNFDMRWPSSTPQKLKLNPERQRGP